MDRALAKVVAVSAFRSAAELNNLIPLLKDNCSAGEYEELRDEIATASLAISQHVLRTVFAKFDGLESEFEQHFSRFGRPA